ncbi:hypothetical protein BX286_0705 [Streptomyces sp. 3211.6]|uniref:hypothetical protein n=1 Tax=Streptomyces TaxID=1883 RepID=UPI0009A47335|nr:MULTISPECIES: hypothetical protein [Streptomyces]RKT02795.1 hypothetical protein BX286_0705 [Streptomyces sp. 3211.6]RPF44119.1 hypothetical protein EDD96_0638 [Streptomyces sp. Ag109_G2-6]
MTGERPVERRLREALEARAEEVTVRSLRPADPPGPHLAAPRVWLRRSAWAFAGLSGLAAAALAGYLVLGPDGAPVRPVPPAAPPELTPVPAPTPSAPSSPSPSAVPSVPPSQSPGPRVTPTPTPSPPPSSGRPAPPTSPGTHGPVQGPAMPSQGPGAGRPPVTAAPSASKG